MIRLVGCVMLFLVILGGVHCWREIEYDKDGDLSLKELVEKYGSIGMLTYELILSDGYIIRVHRLGKKGAEKLKPILLLHGLSGCSDSFFIDKRRAIPFLLASHGYDIWLINNRGTTHSRGHKTLNSTTDKEYWQFSWQEIGLVDLPATIDLILRENENNKVALIGHSEGSFEIFVTLSELPQYNEKVAISFHWGGAAYHAGCASKLVNVACKYRNFIQVFLNQMGITHLMPTDELRNTITSICRLDVFNNVCRDVLFEALVVTTDSFDNFRDISFLFTRWLCGGSTREFIHFLQTGWSGRFARFDYGEEMNKNMYNSTLPPRFHLERITSPTVIFCGLNDIYCRLDNIEKAEAEIPNIVFVKIIQEFGHVDFILDKPFRRYIYNDMLNLLKKYF